MDKKHNDFQIDELCQAIRVLSERMDLLDQRIDRIIKQNRKSYREEQDDVMLW